MQKKQYDYESRWRKYAYSENGARFAVQSEVAETFSATPLNTYATGQATFTKTEVNGIGIVTFGRQADSPFYNLNGVKVEQPGKGLYISDGKKVIVK